MDQSEALIWWVGAPPTGGPRPSNSHLTERGREGGDTFIECRNLLLQSWCVPHLYLSSHSVPLFSPSLTHPLFLSLSPGPLQRSVITLYGSLLGNPSMCLATHTNGHTHTPGRWSCQCGGTGLSFRLDGGRGSPGGFTQVEGTKVDRPGALEGV